MKRKRSRGPTSVTWFDKEQLAAPAAGDQTFAYDTLTLADRWLLQMVAQSVHYGQDDADDDPDGEGDEDGNGEREDDSENDDENEVTRRDEPA